jgi:hypothetical protein
MGPLVGETTRVGGAALTGETKNPTKELESKAHSNNSATVEKLLILSSFLNRLRDNAFRERALGLKNKICTDATFRYMHINNMNLKLTQRDAKFT